ncbi:HAMP domain-containing sensor histidine kinase [Flavobacterium sp.]|uniref:sensor histidine kinase n=1 Tax=Flavobacterium sp. TaxID=239 RepID=UPI002638308C|nr:HAMP domain-containing sensor histidine kinase [Flavobacterium sp.]MDG2432591.1 HAMP domain-containing sensor histidine kinase [Flavobacterium sp.]
MEQKRYNSLFWKISLVFFLLLAMVGVAHVYISFHSSREYLEEVNQRLNHDTAKNIIDNSTPFYNGQVIKPALDEMFHHVMAINPNLEVYLVDPKGKIIAWFPPEKKLTLQKISIDPIKLFIADQNKTLIKGDDPLNPETQKVFSAHPLTMNNMLYAYIYVVLNGEKKQATSDTLFASYLWQISYRTMAITLIFTFVIGLLIIRTITKNYSKILQVMQRFREGDLHARIDLDSINSEKQLATMFNEMADILTTNIDKLKEVENLRRELIANVSHDLRTPIAIIRGYLETLQMKEDTITVEDRKRYIDIVSQSTVKLEKLVNELFELSKLEANQIRPQKEPFIISELVNDISSKYQIIAIDKKIKIETYLSKELAPVLADISLIERVIQNLLDNALKFTPEGGTISIITEKCVNNTVKITISDTGIGIPEKDRERIFARYYRANNYTDLKNSTGLGLAIAKKILDLHDSTLELISAEEKGSSFIFKLKCN